tara:strand:+ start:34910 stop:35050 length:141 start_codon:yes stop_codon:yes gene_type:complete
MNPFGMAIAAGLILGLAMVAVEVHRECSVDRDALAQWRIEGKADDP